MTGVQTCALPIYSFAAGITTGLAAGMPIADAIHLGSRCGVANLSGRGPYAGQLDLRSG